MHVSEPATLHAISLYRAWMHLEIRSSNVGLHIDRGINQSLLELGDIITAAPDYRFDFFTRVLDGPARTRPIQKSLSSFLGQRNEDIFRFSD